MGLWMTSIPLKITSWIIFVVEYERLIKIYMKDHDILEAHKNKIDMLNVEKTNSWEN